VELDGAEFDDVEFGRMKVDELSFAGIVTD
jgi:hypothetical protein